MVLVAGFRMPQVERCKEWYAFCAFLLCLLIGTNDFFMVSSFVIAVCKEKAAELPFRSRWCLKPYPGTGVITHGFSTGELFTFLFFELIYHEPKDTMDKR